MSTRTVVGSPCRLFGMHRCRPLYRRVAQRHVACVAGMYWNVQAIDACNAAFHPKAGLSPQEAWKVLRQLTSADIKGKAPELLASAGFRHTLQAAVQAARANPAPEHGWDPEVQPPQILLGILASDSRMAMRALSDWSGMLGTPFVAPQSRDESASNVASMQGPVYVKYNAATEQCYATKYSGPDRGVLLTLGSTLVGHLPLGLFDGS